MFSKLKSMLWSRDNLYPFELSIIGAVKARLSDDCSTRLQSQLDVVNKVQRLANGKEVNLYRMVRGKAAFDDALRFPYAADEALLATVWLTVDSGKSKLKSEIWLVRGRIFSILYNKPPKNFFGVADLDCVNPEISDVKIWLDPLLRSDVSSAKRATQLSLHGWLLEWHKNGNVSGLQSPLAPTEISERLDLIIAPVPPDYLELLEQTNGAEIGSCIVYGADKMRRITLEDSDYYTLAENSMIAGVALLEGNDQLQLFFIRYETSEIIYAGTSLQQALRKLLDACQ